jgi:molybdopterin synthase sulfur carrier subunit
MGGVVSNVREVGRTMVIRFFASIRNVTNAKEIDWEHSTPTLGELLCLLSDRYGPEFRRWVLEGENLGGSVMVVINGEDARHQAGLETRLAPTDVVSIFPIMAGGLAPPAFSHQRSAFS